jgi:hypothetical protein
VIFIRIEKAGMIQSSDGSNQWWFEPFFFAVRKGADSGGLVESSQ